MFEIIHLDEDKEKVSNKDKIITGKSFSFKCAQAENEKHSSQEIFKVVILKCSRKTYFVSGWENFSDNILNFP